MRQARLHIKTRGQLTIGEIPPIPGAALAAVGKKVRVALICGEKETAAELLRRLGAAHANPIKRYNRLNRLS